jgi:hypothetical protein
MKVVVDPGSNSTFNSMRDRTAEMVSHTMMLSGVSLALLGKVTLTSFGPAVPLCSSNTGKAYSAVRVGVFGDRSVVTPVLVE